MKVEKRERMKQKDLCWVLSISISKIEKNILLMNLNQTSKCSFTIKIYISLILYSESLLDEIFANM